MHATARLCINRNRRKFGNTNSISHVFRTRAFHDSFQGTWKTGKPAGPVSKNKEDVEEKKGKGRMKGVGFR